MNIIEHAKLLDQKSDLSFIGGQRIANLTFTDQDKNRYQDFFSSASLVFPSIGEDWQFTWVNDGQLSMIKPEELYKRLVRNAPPISKVHNRFSRGIITNWAFDGTTPQMQEFIDNTLRTMEESGEPMDTQLERAISYGFWSGAIFSEVVLDSRTREFIRWAITNPFRVRFKPTDDPEAGFKYELGVKDTTDPSQFKSLQGIPTVSYLILNPAIDQPYASPFIDAAVYPMLVLLQQVHNISLMMSGQATPRLNLGWDLQGLSGYDFDKEKLTKFINEQIDKLQNAMRTLEPDQAFILPAGAVVQSDVGRMTRNSFGGFIEIERMLTRWLSQALNVPPSILSFNEGTTQTYADADYRDWYKEQSSYQEKVERSLSNLWTQAARAQGISGEAQFLLERNDELERIRKAEIKTTESAARDKEMEAVGRAIQNGVLTMEEARERYNELFVNEERGEDLNIFVPRTDRLKGKNVQLINNLKNVRQNEVEPLGSDEPLDPIEIPIFNDNAIDNAVKQFEEIFPEYKDLLRASIDDEDADSDWIFHSEDRTYTKDDETLTELERDDKSDLLIDSLYVGVIALALQVSDKDIKVNSWLRSMRSQIMNANISQYLFSKGGVNNLDQADGARLVQMNLTQFEFLQRFAEDLRSNSLSERKLQDRSKQYMESSTAAYERGKLASRVQLALPQVPGDGNQNCKARCRCHLRIEENEVQYEVYWTLAARAQHCGTCLDNSSAWNPLRITKLDLAG